jgi:hypothetical protein
MSEKEQIATKVLRDLCSGMEDTDLMEKYELSYLELRGLYQELFRAGLLLHPEHAES